MFDITSLVPGRKKQTQSGWISFNAICCGHRGHKPDRRGRGGLKLDGNNWVMHCFNCGFSCSFTLGKSISDKTRKFLQWCGADEKEIQLWNLESLQKKDILDLIQTSKREEVKFKQKTLPEGSEKLDLENEKHQVFINYLVNRKIDLSKYTFYVTPNDNTINGRNKHRIIVPYNYKNKLVGYTSRYLDNKIPKYINEQQPGYVFNIDKQKYDWQVCIVTEGIFDALAIDGVAVMHDDISPEQVSILSQLNKRIIVVPDFDKTGLKLIDRALELGYNVSLPNWGPDVKDVNDAVVKYGKLATLLAIMQSATMSRIKLELRKKQIVKGI
jgi:hypothetical protein